MIKKTNTPSSNVSESVEFLLRGAKKRRAMAIASAKMLNSEMGVSARLVAIK